MFPQSDDIPKLSDEDKNNLQQTVTTNEMLMALREMENGKTSCSNGLPIEFYNFWQDIRAYLCKSYKVSFNKCILSISQ